jgi:MoaA/NifB/PqqE/SkfB family radical SAM enzyme
MLSGLHFLLTYACNFECDHCFVYSRPGAKGTLTIGQIRDVLGELVRLGTVDTVYFEGGEPGLYYATMLEGIRIARDLGFKSGIVTNSYWATSDEDAELWLKPLADQGLFKISVSDDELHYGEGSDTPPKRALRAAQRLGIESSVLATAKPVVKVAPGSSVPEVCGGVMFRGRAVEKLSAGLPRKIWREFNRCPHEDLRAPKRVHLDAYGHMHLCQGISMGCVWKTPLSKLVREYDPDAHPICGPLLRGGPAALAQEYDFPCEERYIDACHLCFAVRLALIDRFPEFLAPRQVYGLKD